MPTEYCSFCGKHEREVKKLVAGPADVGICDECHALMLDLMPDPIPPTDEERKANSDAVDELIEMARRDGADI